MDNQSFNVVSTGLFYHSFLLGYTSLITSSVFYFNVVAFNARRIFLFFNHSFNRAVVIHLPSLVVTGHLSFFNVGHCLMLRRALFSKCWSIQHKPLCGCLTWGLLNKVSFIYYLIHLSLSGHMTVIVIHLSLTSWAVATLINSSIR